MSALDNLAVKRQARAKARRNGPRAVAEDGPYDRRLTTNRRVSVTALLPAEVDTVALRQCIGGVVLSSDLATGPHIAVRTVGARREVWLRGPAIRELLPGSFSFRRDRSGRRHSVALDAYLRRFPSGTVELELLVRGTRTTPW